MGVHDVYPAEENSKMNTGSQTSIPISMLDLTIGLTLSVVLGMLLVFVYRFTHKGFNYERSFLVTLVLICPVVAVVMMMIGSNLALSLGMVGALSIVRFRTVIKDTRDMVFLFLAIAVGLGCGTYNWVVIIVASTFISAVLLVFNLFQFGRRLHSEYIVVLSGNGPHPEKSIIDVVKKFATFVQIRSLELDGEQWEMVLETRIDSDDKFQEPALVASLKEAHKVEKISILSPQLSLPL